MERAKVGLTLLTAFLQTDDEIVAEHRVLQHRRGFVDHDQRRNAGFPGFRLNTVHNVADDRRRQGFILENMGKVKCDKAFGVQIQTVVGGIEDFAVLVGIDPAEQFAAHVAGRRETTFIKVAHHPFFRTQIVKRRGYRAGDFAFGKRVVNHGDGFHPAAEEGPVVGRRRRIKRI